MTNISNCSLWQLSITVLCGTISIKGGIEKLGSSGGDRHEKNNYDHDLLCAFNDIKCL